MIVVCSIWKSVGFGLIRFSWRLIIIDPYPKNVTFTCVQPKLAGNLDAVWAACIPQRRTRKMRLNKYMKSKTWNSKCFLVLGMFFIFGIQLASWSKVCSIQNDVPKSWNILKVIPNLWAQASQICWACKGCSTSVRGLFNHNYSGDI